MYEEYEEEVHFITINVRDKQEDGRKVIKDNNYTFPVLYDEGEEIASLYRVQPIPLNIFIDANGEITGKIIGAINEKDLEAYLQNIIE